MCVCVYVACRVEFGFRKNRKSMDCPEHCLPVKLNYDEIVGSGDEDVEIQYIRRAPKAAKAPWAVMQREEFSNGEVVRRLGN